MTRVTRAPQYEGLRIKDLLAVVNATADLKPYFPEKRDWGMLPRDWIINVSQVV